MKNAVIEIFVKFIDYKMDDVKIMIQIGFPAPKFTFEKQGMYAVDVFVTICCFNLKVNLKQAKTSKNQFKSQFILVFYFKCAS